MGRSKDMTARLILAAAALAGASYLIAVGGELAGPAIVLWKGAGVGLLALYAALVARDADGWLITAVMGFCAAGDMLLETAGLVSGAAAFAIGHAIAVILYLKNRRPNRSFSQRLAAASLAIGTPAIGWILTGSAAVAGYSAALGVMAGLAWLSRFPRYRTGIGAALFVASDLLIFAKMDIIAEAAWVSLATWGLYFAGQLLIVLGVTRTLRASRQA